MKTNVEKRHTMSNASPTPPRITWSEHQGWGEVQNLRHFPAVGQESTNCSYGNGASLCGDVVPMDQIVFDPRDSYAIGQICRDCWLSRNPPLTTAEIMGGEAHGPDGRRLW